MAKTAQRAKKNSKPRAIPVIIYKTYSFTGKDPVIQDLKTAAARRGLTIAQLAGLSGVSYACITNWFSGDTKRPQYATVKAVANAIGISLD